MLEDEAIGTSVSSWPEAPDSDVSVASVTLIAPIGRGDAGTYLDGAVLVASRPQPFAPGAAAVLPVW